jgi:thioesterase domain-containing protein
MIVNHYGPTETTIGVITGRLTVDGRIPIGTPVPNTRVYILDRHLRPSPVGVAGELFIGGAGLARGYRDRAELTAERFVADPFAADGSRLYRSGDRARWRSDGQVEFLGRVDHQVKVRGFRIEPGEVEAALTAHPGVSAAAVIADGEGANRRLVAYAVTDSAADLRRFLKDRVPEHLIPAVFVELDALPLTSNGKLDRAALPAPDSARPDQADRYVAPATPVEETLAEIWAEVLGLDRVGVHDDFFDLGGHSLLVTQVVARLRTLGWDIGVGDFFDHPTVHGTAPLITTGRGASSLVEIRGGTVEPAVFCVHSGTGGVVEFAELAGRLGAGQQFYGLRSRGLVAGEQLLETVEEMAEAYLAEIKTVQPNGPYLLAGWSMGGYVAVEMARRIAASGDTVGAVLVVAPPTHELRDPAELSHQQAEIREVIDDLDSTPLRPETEKFLTERWVRGEDVLTADEHGRRAARTELSNFLASLGYRAGLEPYDGRVVLYLPDDDPAESEHRALTQWRSALSREPEIVRVPGRHLTVIHEAGAEAVGSHWDDEIRDLS